MHVNKNRNGRTMAQTVHLRGCPSDIASQYLAPMSMTSLGQIGVLKGTYTVCQSVLYLPFQCFLAEVSMGLSALCVCLLQMPSENYAYDNGFCGPSL